MTYTLENVIDAFRRGEKQSFLFFWGHRPRPDGVITETCLSNWWESAFTVERAVYPTSEHWMMAEKARLFNDDKALQAILKSKTPGEAKKLGRGIKNFDAALWDAHKYRIVCEGNFHKFSQHEPLKNFLLKTGSKILVEASPVDAIWGIGIAKDHATIHDPTTWQGENLLGFALMTVRDKLRMA
jgi:ribA/ribD-fused uncharacterized protein